MCFTGEGYYLLEAGLRRCPKGYEVMDTTECEEACDQLNIRPSGKKFKDGKPCYKGGSGVCNQNGAFNRRASLICKEEDNEDGGGGMLRVISLLSDQKCFSKIISPKRLFILILHFVIRWNRRKFRWNVFFGETLLKRN